ncbi:MAG: phosphoenolpyruvate synthase [Desulfomonile sp.]|nr:phosphoenolpyruvate synthase [Desulfomonile sp.]
MHKAITKFLDKIRSWKHSDRARRREQVSRLFRFKYTCFKDLLASNTELLNIITDLEEKLRGQEVFGMSYVRSQSTRALFHALRMVKSLDDLSGHRYASLFGVVDRLNEAIKEELGKRKELPVSEWVLPYSRITRDMVDWVGGKNANLGELRNRVGVPVPEGFAVTTRAYQFFLERNDLIDEINRKRMDLDVRDPMAVNQVSEEIQRLIITAPVPEELQKTILQAYDEMAARARGIDALTNGQPRVALRSSAIGEDSELSYAGQYLSVLNVTRDRIIDTYKLILASLYTPRAISYRLNKGLRDEDIAMSVACIEMVPSVASGVIYTRHPFNPIEDNIVVTAVWGLGPYAVDGVITPDMYVVSKDLDFTLIESRVSAKPVQLVANPTGGLSELPVDESKQHVPCLSREQIRTLAEYALNLERHYNYPQDIEWALDPSERLLVLQTRPLHLESLQKADEKTFPIVEGYPLVVERGVIAFPGVGYGPAAHIHSQEDLLGFPEGAVLVARHSTPEYVLVMQKARAIVTDTGSITGHMASLAREFGVPTILDAKVAFAGIPPGADVTVDAYSGRVYLGKVEELMGLQRTRESLMKDSPVFQTLRKVADVIVPLHLVNPRSPNFTAEHCETIHDLMRLVHELSYREMFQISDMVSDNAEGGALKLVAPIPLDLHIIDLGGGLQDVSAFSSRITVDNISSIPMKALLKGMLLVGTHMRGPRPIDLGGFLSVMREQMFQPNSVAERFGDRSYAIIADKYLNFSSRIGYHYSVLDSYCGDTVSKNYITFSFKGGAADEVRRNRRARAIAQIFQALEFVVEVREDRVDARFYKYERAITEEKLDMVGRMLQFTRQMDMLMHCDATIDALAQSFLSGDYDLDRVLACAPEQNAGS